MALKDWRKVQETRTLIVFVKKDKDIFIKKIKIGWKVIISANKLIKKSFKTKAQALRFAKSYMKKN